LLRPRDQPGGRHGRKQETSAGFARINIHEPWDLQYWSERWNVSRRQVVGAIRRVGDKVEDIARAMRKLSMIRHIGRNEILPKGKVRAGPANVRCVERSIRNQSLDMNILLRRNT